MKIAVYSITRDRRAYTETCFYSLYEKAGAPFNHYVVDNGSQDGTVEWLEKEYKPVWLWPLDENMGISIASNLALRAIFASSEPPDLVLKIDNDCLCITPNILSALASIYSDTESSRWVLSPRVDGIVNQPKRVRYHKLAGWNVGVTAIVGGLFHVVPAPIYREYVAAGGYPETLPLAHGQDDHFMDWLARKSYAKGYVEDLTVEHYRGTHQQAIDYPDYFRNKWDHDEKHPYGSRP